MLFFVSIDISDTIITRKEGIMLNKIYFEGEAFSSLVKDDYSHSDVESYKSVYDDLKKIKGVEFEEIMKAMESSFGFKYIGNIFLNNEESYIMEECMTIPEIKQSAVKTMSGHYLKEGEVRDEFMELMLLDSLNKTLMYLEDVTPSGFINKVMVDMMSSSIKNSESVVEIYRLIDNKAYLCARFEITN